MIQLPTEALGFTHESSKNNFLQLVMAIMYLLYTIYSKLYSFIIYFTDQNWVYWQSFFFGFCFITMFLLLWHLAFLIFLIYFGIFNLCYKKKTRYILLTSSDCVLKGLGTVLSLPMQWTSGFPVNFFRTIFWDHVFWTLDLWFLLFSFSYEANACFEWFEPCMYIQLPSTILSARVVPHYQSTSLHRSLMNSSTSTKGRGTKCEEKCMVPQKFPQGRPESISAEMLWSKK